MKRKHSTIKLEATGKHTNTRKHTKKVKLHQNLIQILYFVLYFEPLNAAPELIQKHYA